MLDGPSDEFETAVQKRALDPDNFGVLNNFLKIISIF